MTGILKVDQWKDSGDNALMTSDGAGNLSVDVNLGIKNSSPSHTLDISDTTTTAKTLRVGQSSGTSTADATMIISNGGSGDAMLRFDYEGSNTDRARIGVTSSGQTLRFYTAGANERMAINNSGYVGIGTASPTDLLDVRGSIKARDASDNVGRFHTRNAFTVTNGTAVQLTSVCGSAIVCVSCNTTGSGGLFWGTFSTTVSKLAGNGLTSDSGTDDIAVYKNSSSNLMYFKNRSGFSRDYVITVYAARHA